MRHYNVKGKITLKFEDREGASRNLVDIELDDMAIIEIASYIDGFWAGKECVVLGRTYGSTECIIADRLLNRYAGDTTTERLKFYKMLCEKLRME